ncbi:MAG: hypothetical protein ACLFN5_02140 [bacterium]
MSEKKEEGYRWSYKSGVDAALIIRGRSVQYNLTFIAVIKLSVDEGKENLKIFKTFAEQDYDRIYSLDIYSPPVRLRDKIDDLIEETSDSPSRRDTFHLSKKLKKILERTAFLFPFGEYLRNDDLQSAQKQLQREIENQLFPASKCEFEIRISRWSSISDRIREDNELVEKIKPAIRHCLDIHACINPVHGRPLADISLKELLLVRVVGDSVKKLNPELVEVDEQNRVFSKPIPAPLAAIKVAERKGELQYWVKFKEGVYGEGIQPASARVELAEKETNKVTTDFKGLIYSGTVLLAVFFISIFLLFVGFPDYFLIFFF